MLLLFAFVLGDEVSVFLLLLADLEDIVLDKLYLKSDIFRDNQTFPNIHLL